RALDIRRVVLGVMQLHDPAGDRRGQRTVVVVEIRKRVLRHVDHPFVVVTQAQPMRDLPCHPSCHEGACSDRDVPGPMPGEGGPPASAATRGAGMSAPRSTMEGWTSRAGSSRRPSPLPRRSGSRRPSPPRPRPRCRAGWRGVARARDTLVVAPPGSGKTLPPFLGALDRLALPRPAAGPTDRAAQAPPGSPPRRAGTRVLYLSPLKALGVDVERNLTSPLVGTARTAQRRGVPTSPLSVGVRTGDTPAAERRRLLSHPPDILITTPESLFLMLTSQARETLRGVDTVILDEVHAVAGTKRGVHLALSLARLDAMLEAPAQRIGLSATVEPVEEVAAFLTGTGRSRETTVVRPGSTKSWDLTVTLPVADLQAIEPPADAV